MKMEHQIIIEDTKERVLSKIQNYISKDYNGNVTIENNQLVHKYVDSSLDADATVSFGFLGLVIGFFAGAILAEYDNIPLFCGRIGIGYADAINCIFVVAVITAFILGLIGLYINKLSPNKTDYLGIYLRESNGKTLAKADYSCNDSMESEIMDFLVLNYGK